MHRIDGPGATQSGQFTEGDPTQGVPATTVTGPWLNAIQEEIAHVVESAGLTLSKPDNTQLRAAILAIISANQVQAWYTGDVRLTMRDVADAGWVLCDDGTIGPAGSGATSRQDDDTEALFTLLWDNIPDGFAPVSGGRGATAQDDWLAGKTISLTRMMGRALAIAGGGSGLTSRQLGQYLGAETHVLTEAEIPAHDHSMSLPRKYGSNQGSGTGFSQDNGTTSNGTGTTTASGGGQAHNNMQPTAFLNAMVKL